MGQGARPPVTRKLPYLKSYRDRHGRERHYFRRPPAPNVPLPGEHGSKEFMEAYWRLRDGTAKRELGDAPEAGTIAAVVVAYYKSKAFTDLQPKTRATYRGLLEEFREKWGGEKVRGLRQRHVAAIIDGRKTNQQNWRKVIRLALNLAVERGWIDVHPMQGLRRPRKALQGFRAWSPEDIAKYLAHWSKPGSRERLALALLLYTGQRRSDVVGMGRQHVKDGKIHVVQQKTGTRLAIRLHAALKAELEHVPLGQLTFLQTQQGQPFTANGFGNWFRECAKAAGLPERSNAHGLRKAAAVMLAEAGCTASQIMAVTGHKNLSEVTLYTASADQERLADEAMDKAEARTKVSNPASRVRQTRKKAQDYQ